MDHDRKIVGFGQYLARSVRERSHRSTSRSSYTTEPSARRHNSRSDEHHRRKVHILIRSSFWEKAACSSLCDAFLEPLNTGAV